MVSYRNILQMTAADRTGDCHLPAIWKAPGFPGAEPVVAVYKLFQIAVVCLTHRILVCCDEQRCILMCFIIPFDSG